MTQALKSEEFEKKLTSAVDDSLLRGIAADLLMYAQTLENKLVLLEHSKYGRSSERYVDPRQGMIFNEPEACEDEIDNEDDNPSMTLAPAHERKKRRPKLELPANLKRNITIHDLAEDERRCACCAEPMQEIGEEKTEKLHVVAPKVEVQVDVYKKYACKSCQESPVQALREMSAVPRIKATDETLAFIAVKKYVFGVPLYRLEQLFEACGVALSRYVMSLWMIKLAEVLRPIYSALERDLLARDYMHMDETTLQVLREPGRSATSKSFVWVRTSGGVGSQAPPIALYTYDPRRAAEVASRLIGNFNGHLQTDDYSGYSSALASRPEITHVLCWDHARRYFWDAYQAIPKAKRDNTAADRALKLIGKLYKIEERGKELSAAERLKLRETESLKALENLRSYCEKERLRFSDSAPTAIAMDYMLSNWAGLLVYTTDAKLNISNSPAEQRVRPFAVGRKNFLFSNTPRGAEASTILYTIIETAKLNGIEPLAYITRTLRQIARGDKIEDMMPLRKMG